MHVGFFCRHHWIAGTLKHGYRHQNCVSICPRSEVMSKYVILTEIESGHFENGRFRIVGLYIFWLASIFLVQYDPRNKTNGCNRFSTTKTPQLDISQAIIDKY